MLCLPFEDTVMDRMRARMDGVMSGVMTIVLSWWVPWQIVAKVFVIFPMLLIELEKFTSTRHDQV